MRERKQPAQGGMMNDKKQQAQQQQQPHLFSERHVSKFCLRALRDVQLLQARIALNCLMMVMMMAMMIKL
jgi:hypothetical protein